MPYITKLERQTLDRALDALLDELERGKWNSPGIFNYIITQLLLYKVKLEATDPKIPKYSQLNEAVGILECCKLEIYRRLGAQIEDSAIFRNGDLEFYK